MTSGIQNIIGKKLIGLYLFGSLTYGDFNPESSDIDLLTVINKPLNHYELDQIKQLHNRIEEKCQKWSHRLECSYTPIDLFKNTLPPKELRPYYGGGIFYDEAPYGNEWIINNYLLYNYGVSLIGSDFKKLIKPIDIIEVQKDCIRDLFQEWEPKITDFEWLDNSHYQSYLILNLCRILYTVCYGAAGTKKVSAEWVKNQYGMPWINLIETAGNWKYGKVMSMRNESINFIKFVIDYIKATTLYQEMYPEKKYDIQHISNYLNRVVAWAKKNTEIDGIALVGSYARNQAKEYSDIDLIILTNSKGAYISNKEWLNQFGDIEISRLENYGAVTSWHVHYKNSHEVEFGIALPSWTNHPVDQGTKEVISDGIIILYDPKDLFKKLINSL
jgi:predicted nucleotidyltransferase